MIIVILGASVAGVLLVLLLEFLNRGYRSGEQIEETTGVRALGLVPLIKGSRRKKRQPETTLVRHPTSLFGEAVRSIYTSILFSQNQTPPKTLLVTSCFPKEGKTTLSSCLARLCAMSGKHTVIVEGDLRKPQLHTRFGIPQGPGLVEYFLGETDLSHILYRDELTGAYVIPSGRASIDASKLLDSPEMGRLLAGLADQFDLVLLDTPPVMAVADARVLAPQVDGVVFVVRWSKTDREVVKLGLKNLADSGGRLVGAVLSMVDVEQHAQYSFGDSGYYHKGVKSYYVQS
jgi:capsular exopolysaccharide synthesis family protein